VNPHYTKAGSLNIAETGRRIRASRRRLTESEELNGSLRAWKVWAACSELTASWSKGSDRVHVLSIANLADLRPDKVSPILRKFHELGIFGWVKDEGKRSPGILSLPSLGEKPERAAPAAREGGTPEIEAPEPEGPFTCGKKGCEVEVEIEGAWCRPHQAEYQASRKAERERERQARAAAPEPAWLAGDWQPSSDEADKEPRRG
jgi:hypothetical protein